VTGTVGFYRPRTPGSKAILRPLSSPSEGTFRSGAYGRHDTRNTEEVRKGVGTMTPGTVGDWMMLTVLLGGLATVSWLVYAWVLGGETEREAQAVDVRQEDLETAA
jgi:hypothetical protein